MNDPRADMLTLLAQERDAILHGQYDRLASIAADMTDCATRLQAQSADPTALIAIKKHMERNQNLIGAALGGIAAAQERVNAMQSVRDGLKTYDPSGKIDTVTTARSKLEKKA